MTLCRFYQDIIAEPNQVRTLEDAILDGRLIYSKLAADNLAPKTVKKGQALIQKVSETVDEKNIHDFKKSKPEPGMVFRIDNFGENLGRPRGGDSWFAEEEGVFFVSKSVPRVIEVNYDATYKIKIGSDNMSVDIDFFPPGPGGKKILIKEVFEDLRKLKVEVEIKTEAIDRALMKLEESKIPIYDINVANGALPIDGIDARVDVYVETDVDFSPKVLDSGRLDFYNLNILNPVEKDQLLAVYHPHVEGRNGKDVFGQEIPGKTAKVIKFPAGKNTYSPPANSNEILAKCEGNVIEKKGVFSVSEVFSINGNVDFSTGNIENSGSVKVFGDIKSGFRLDIGDTVEIKGIVEDAVIMAGDNVQINSGFVGTGSGLIAAEGDVNLKYIRNQKIQSRKSINVKNEVIDAELFARDRIRVKGGKNMSILGGHTIAGNLIEVNCLGNEYGIQTRIEVGFDYKQEIEISFKRQEIERLTSALETIDGNLSSMFGQLQLSKEKHKTLAKLVDQKLKLYEAPEEYDDFYEYLEKLNKGIELILKNKISDGTRFEYFLTLFEQKISFAQQIKVNKLDILRLNKKIYEPSSARIIVSKKAYPGVTILINKRKFVITEEMINKTFYLSKENDSILFG
ncbi:MAG: DUF342 domain-containing protein [Rhodothermaceae bacterium]